MPTALKEHSEPPFSPESPPSKNSKTLFVRTANAFAWRFGSESSKVGLRLVVLVILTRLLPVSAFGVLALAMIVISFAYEIFEMGMAPAVVQSAELTPIHIRSAFLVSWLSGILITGAIWFGAPLFGIVFRSPEVVPILRLIGVSFLFASLGAISSALLQRRLEYRTLMLIDVGSYLLGYALVGIVLAWMGYGVWALAWAAVVQSFLKTVFTFRASPHPIKPVAPGPEMRKLLNFGLGMSFSRIANLAAINGDNFVVGRWLGTIPLGLYSRAYQIVSMPKYQFSSVMDDVLFPAYSSIQTEQVRLARAYLASLSLCSIVAFPMLTALAVSAPELMTGVFGPEWAGAAQPLQILCLGGMLRSVYGLGDSIARAKGAVYATSRCQTIYAVCVVAGSIIGTRWGLRGVAVGVVAATIVMYALMAQLSIRLTESKWKGFLFSQFPGLILAISVAGVALPGALLLRSMNLNALLVLCATLAASVSAFVAAGLLLPRPWLNELTAETIDKVKLQCLSAIGVVRARLGTS